MPAAKGLYYDGGRAMVATMHAKEQAISPIIESFLGLCVEVTAIDTDAFGTFSRDIARTGSQLDAARAKIQAAFAKQPEVKVAIASEGIFGPHPIVPFCALGREIVVLADRTADLELIGHYATTDTNYAQTVVSDIAGGLAFADRVGFPDHGVIVMGYRDGQPAHDLWLEKDARTWEDLRSILDKVIAELGVAFVEADMRAYRNPRRMRSIKRATINLARHARSACPRCQRAGYAISGRLPGLPCSWCGGPTQVTRAELWSCAGCGHRIERAVAAVTADPAQCGRCNP